MPSTRIAPGSLSSGRLPVQLSAFVGRERECVEVIQHLETTRLLTLVGTGGIGKTRLALEVARALEPTYADGVRFVELASLSDAVRVPDAVAAGLRLHDISNQSAEETLTNFLRDQHLLLVIDNCEHLLDAVGRVVEKVLRGHGCDGVRILATSRQALGVQGETAWRVPPMRVPDLSATLGTDEIAASEGVRLFCQRAQSVQPRFALHDLNAAAVAQVCQRLDGIPLAIELAAARVRILTPLQILARLDDRMRLLVGGSRTAERRHQTLRATLDWSYALLDERERALLRRLGVFAGGWSLEAAEYVGATSVTPPEDVLDLLDKLADRSLVVVDMEKEAPQAHYHLLDTVRNYALEKLSERGETDASRRPHLEWYVELVERAQAELSGPEQAVWLDRLQREHDNLRAALSYARDTNVELGLRLAAGLGRFWGMRGHFVEGQGWFDGLLACAPAPTPARAHALLQLGHLCIRSSNFECARTALEESLSLLAELHDRRRAAEAQRELGAVHLVQGRLASARELATRSLAISSDLGDQAGAGWTLARLGAIARTEGKLEDAAPHFERSLALLRPGGDPEALGYVLNNLGQLARARGDYITARRLLEESLGLFRSIGATSRMGWTLGCLSSVALLQEELQRADTLLDEARVLLESIGDRRTLFQGLWIAGVLAIKRNQYARGVRMIAAGARYPLVRARLDPDELHDWDTSMELARRQLGAARFDAAVAEGEAMSLEEAIAYGLTRNRTRASLSANRQRPALTQREREVASLIVEGCSNREIAERLVISERTAEAHVSNLLTKASVRSRAQLAVWAIQAELAPEHRVGRR